MKFSPAFSLLAKFSIDIGTAPKTEQDVSDVAVYLGADLRPGPLQSHIEILAQELQRQNVFLSENLSLDSIFHSEIYKRSIFVREVVANNRENLANKAISRERL